MVSVFHQNSYMLLMNWISVFLSVYVRNWVPQMTPMTVKLNCEVEVGGCGAHKLKCKMGLG